MKKSKSQKDYYNEIDAYYKENNLENPNKKPRKSFRETKLYYYGIRIIIILILLQLINMFDNAAFNIINFYR